MLVLMSKVELTEKMYFEKGVSTYRETYRQRFWAFPKKIVELTEWLFFESTDNSDLKGVLKVSGKDNQGDKNVIWQFILASYSPCTLRYGR